MIFSFTPFFTISRNVFFISLSYLAFMFGLGFLFDFLDHFLNKKSFLTSGNLQEKTISFLGFSLVFGILLEGMGKFFGKFWYYPYHNAFTYFLFIYPEYVSYCFLMMESFWLTSNLIRNNKQKAGPKLVEAAKIFRYCWIACIIVLIPIVFMSTYPTTLTALIGRHFTSGTPVYLFVVFALFFWFFIESLYIEKEGKTTLFFLFQAVIAASATAFIFEFYNSFLSAWVYDNVPFSGISLFKVPALVFVFWPVQYFILIPLYNLFFRAEDNKG